MRPEKQRGVSASTTAAALSGYWLVTPRADAVSTEHRIPMGAINQWNIDMIHVTTRSGFQAQALSTEEMATVVGGDLKESHFNPMYTAPKVLSDDGINIRTSDPTTTNVGYDSPFTPIRA